MSSLNPHAAPFVPSSAGFFYYQVTKGMNLEGIMKGGLQPKLGSSGSGMSALRYKANAQSEGLTEAFLEGSKNKVHLTQNWEAVERYATHMFALGKKVHGGENNVPLNHFPSILRCHLFDKRFLTADPHDTDGLCYSQIIPPDKICVLVSKKIGASAEYSASDISYAKGENCWWAPISAWDPNYYTPALPDHPNWPTMQASVVFPINF